MSLPAAVVQRAADVDEIHARVGRVAARLAQAHAELVALTEELFDGDVWAGTGVRSPEHWLVAYAGLSPSRAREVVALARRSAELPETITALSAGRLGIDQAAVVARLVPAAYSRQASELAELATVPQLRRALSRYAFDEPDRVAEPGSPEPDVVPPVDPEVERPTLSLHTLDGRFRLAYSAPASIGALVEQALREAKDALFAGGATEATLADALVEVADRSLSGVAGTARETRYRVLVHLDTAGGWIGRGGALPRHLIDRLTCDGVLQPVWETAGRPVNVGRSQRIVPARTRRLVESRDGGCRFPGCRAAGHAEVHHLVHWRDGGRTDLDGLILLCPWHHDRHHEGAFTITGDPSRPDGLTFWARGRWPIRPTLPDAAGSANAADRPDPPLTATATTSHHGPDPTGRMPRADGIPWHGPTGERLHGRHLRLAPNPETPAAGRPRSDP